MVHDIVKIAWSLYVVQRRIIARTGVRYINAIGSRFKWTRTIHRLSGR